MRLHTADNLLRIVLASSLALAACADGGSSSPDRGAAAADSVAPRRTTAEAGGEVATDSAKPVLRWLGDANVIALLNTMNGRELAAADAELSSWHVDTVRAFAAEMAREHAAMQRSIDSAAAALRLGATSPALAPLVRARMQAQIDSMYQHGGRAFDRAYVDQQIANDQIVYQYLARLSAISASPGLQQVLTVLSDTVKSQLQRASALRATIAIADSIAADSVAKRAARRAARLKAEQGR